MQVEIWSDVICPWCYIGKRRFEDALTRYREAHPNAEVDVAFRSFQLDPTAPPGVSEPVIDAYAKKFGGPERAAEIIERVSTEAAGEGLEFRMNIAQRSNTLLAHRLLVLAEAEGLQHELKERIMRAYFTEGRAIGDQDVLVELAEEIGMDAEQAQGWLGGNSGNAEVIEHFEFASGAGITAVPTFVFDRISAVPGAQSADILFEALEFNAAGRPAT